MDKCCPKDKGEERDLNIKPAHIAVCTHVLLSLISSFILFKECTEQSDLELVTDAWIISV